MKIVKPSAVYAMIGASDPIRHVVTELTGEGALRSLSVSEMARSYTHSIQADLHRIKLHEKRSSDYDARIWLIEYALSELGEEQVEEIEGDTPKYRLKKPVDEIRYEGNKVHINQPEPDPDWAGGSDPFNPLNGRFAVNIRDKSEKDDLTELRESMRAFGWLPELPGLKDERDAILIGHRREKVARELDIPEVWNVIELGFGKAADARRLQIAIASNTGSKPMTPTTLANIAAYLYNDRKWDQQRIAEALKVSQSTVSDAVARHRPRLSPSDNPGRSGTGSTREYHHQSAITPKITAEIRHILSSGQEPNRTKLGEHFGVGKETIRREVNRLKEMMGIPTTKKESKAKSEPEPQPEAQPQPKPEVSPTVENTPDVSADPVQTDTPPPQSNGVDHTPITVRQESEEQPAKQESKTIPAHEHRWVCAICGIKHQG